MMRSPTIKRNRRLTGPFVGLVALLLIAGQAAAQLPEIRYGAEVPPEVKLIYERGLEYLARTQQPNGSWTGGQTGPGITGMCLMAFLAHGEDPNFGKYKLEIHRAVRNIIQTQNVSTGYLGNSMYHHGFGMLALAEAYGSVDDALLWDGEAGGKQRSIGEALELAVRCAITAQKQNSAGAWRYSPTSTDADTSVSGAVLVGLLAARNAGIEVPDENIDKALSYFQGMTTSGGMVGYSGGASAGESMARSSIATLVFAVGKRREWPQFAATSRYLVSNMGHNEGGHPFYFEYYMSQALFQSDFEAWTKWKRENTTRLRNMQQEDGSFTSGYGPAYSTAMSLLSLALDYRLLPIYER
jgi:hypothetical protein